MNNNLLKPVKYLKTGTLALKVKAEVKSSLNSDAATLKLVVLQPY